MRTVLVLLLCLMGSSAALASPLTIDSSFHPYRTGLENQGWWPEVLGYSNTSETDSYWTGWSGDFPDTELRSFFSFYLDPSLLAGMVVTDASLILRRYDAQGDAPQETLGLFDVTSPLATVMHNVGSNFAVWSDLGSGVSYGSLTFDVQGDPLDDLVIALTPAAVAAINSGIGGYFTIGGAIVSGQGSIFRQSGPEGTQALALNVAPVPEPSSLALLLAGLGLIAFLFAKIPASVRSISETTGD